MKFREKVDNEIKEELIKFRSNLKRILDILQQMVIGPVV